jgi:hypothetical protein
MKKEEIRERISDALEAELGKIYDELGVNSGDISPLDLLEWEKHTAETTEIFLRLINWNTPEE